MWSNDASAISASSPTRLSRNCLRFDSRGKQVLWLLFQGGLVFKAHRLQVSILGSRVKRKNRSSVVEKIVLIVEQKKKQCQTSRLPPALRTLTDTTTPESKKGSPKVNLPSRQWFSKVATRHIWRLRMNLPPPSLWRGSHTNKHSLILPTLPHSLNRFSSGARSGRGRRSSWTSIPHTLNPKPEALNPKPQTPNPKP